MRRSFELCSKSHPEDNIPVIVKYQTPFGQNIVGIGVFVRGLWRFDGVITKNVGNAEWCLSPAPLD